jgi:hypothetical protein
MLQGTEAENLGDRGGSEGCTERVDAVCEGRWRGANDASGLPVLPPWRDKCKLALEDKEEVAQPEQGERSRMAQSAAVP